MAFEELVARFKRDLEKFGAATTTAADPSAKPAQLRAVSNERADDCLLFLWNVTPGGKNRKETEWRIQVTAATKFPLQLGTRTIIGGWNERYGVWAFWDVMRHTRFSKKSPSFQLHVDTLERAAHYGIATQSRKTDPPEIVVAVQPEYLLWYVQNGATIHNSRLDATGVNDLVDAPPELERHYLDESETEDQATRRYALVEAVRAYRAAKFKPGVLIAYRYKCAVCGVALNLVDAAHIVPVAHPTSVDDISNGLGLCRLHHAAYDNALIGIRPDHGIVMNPSALSRLEELDLLHGLDEFRARLPERITTPSSMEVRPRPEFLRLGMQLRQWPETLID